jgi:ferredoxin
MIIINDTVCDMCGTCIGVCPTSALLLTKSSLDIIHESCTDCGNCVTICPVAALKLKD